MRLLTLIDVLATREIILVGAATWIICATAFRRFPLTSAFLFAVLAPVRVRTLAELQSGNAAKLCAIAVAVTVIIACAAVRLRTR